MKIEDLVMCDGKLFIDYLKDNALDAGVKMDEWTEGYEACKSRLAKILIPQIKANAIPDTHCIVPKRPTEAMLNAMTPRWGKSVGDNYKAMIEKAMIAASQNDN